MMANGVMPEVERKLSIHRTSCESVGNLREFHQISLRCSRHVSKGEPWLHPVGCSCAVLEPVISFDGYLSSRHVEDDISEPAAVVFVPERNQAFKVLLEAR